MLFHYQTLIAGCVGFLGVIISIIANGYFARKQDRKQRLHEKNTIIAALRSELKVNLATIETRANQLSQPFNPNNQGYLPMSVFNDVYKMSLDKIGVMDESQAEQIIKVYLLLEELPTKMELMAGNSINNSSFVQFTSPEQKQYAASEHRIIADMLRDTVEKIA
ncbi:hypothetical protein VrSk94_10370 [Vibrio rotiferianus]